MFKSKKKIDYSNYGEIVNYDDVVIKMAFIEHPIKAKKMRDKVDYYYTHGYFKDDIILNKYNVLIDGYSSYKLAGILGLKRIMIKRQNNETT